MKSTRWTRACPPKLPQGAQAGFSLLELLAAMALFAIIVVGFVQARNRAMEQAGDAKRERILRFLAGYQMGYVRLGWSPDQYVRWTRRSIRAAIGG